MIARCIIGTGVTGATRYVLGEGRGVGNDNLVPGEQSRVVWIGGTGFGFEISTAEDADLARRIMEFDALNQASRTRRCEKDVLHLVLSWRPGETPDRAEMEEAARGALAALGMANAKAIFVCHGDERHPHVHIVASKIDPATGRAYDLKGNYGKLSAWALAWEREHGGVLCLGREIADRLRGAIAARDAEAVLAELTRQRSTFSAADLERALAKQIAQPEERAAFAAEILALPAIVRLSDRADGEATRYTSREVLFAEQQTLRAAEVLANRGGHGVSDTVRDAVLERFPTIRADQKEAFEHAIGRSGLALIDGQAGTGKSYTMVAIREAYEFSRFEVIGLAPTNVVAKDMARDGFRRAGTVHSELFALNSERRAWSERTVVMVDEAAMIDTRLMAMLSAHAQQAGAKLILVGDDRQLSSIERGGMFGALKDRYGAAALTEVTRQYKEEDRRAASMLAEGNFVDAIGIYDAKGGIQWRRTQEQAQAALVDRWASDSAADPDKSRFVFAYTNADVGELNAALRAVRAQRGEFGPDHLLPTRDGALAVAVGDRLQLTANDKERGLVNGAVGTVLAIDGTAVTMQLDGRRGPSVSFNAEAFPDFRYGYAGTIYKGQGRTLDQTYLYHSEHWRSAASYVALTRHRDKAEIFVATNTARDAKELARQMARVDERRAASQFHVLDAQAPVASLTPRELLAALGGSGTAASVRAASPSVPENGRESGRMIEPDSDDLAAQHKREAEALEQRRLEAERKVFLDEMTRQAEEARKKEDERQRADAERRSSNEVTDAGGRYAQSLADHYDILRPYQSLARAAMDEYAKFVRGQKELLQQSAAEKDPELRQLIDLRRKIEAVDYMAVTSERLIRINQGNIRDAEHPDIKRDVTYAKAWAEDGAELRKERAALVEERARRTELHMAPVQARQTAARQDTSTGQQAPQAEDAPKKPDFQEEQKEAAKRAGDQSQPSVAGEKPYDAKTATPAEKAAEKQRLTEEMTKAREEMTKKLALERTQGRPGGRGR